MQFFTEISCICEKKVVTLHTLRKFCANYYEQYTHAENFFSRAYARVLGGNSRCTNRTLVRYQERHPLFPEHRGSGAATPDNRVLGCHQER